MSSGYNKRIDDFNKSLYNFSEKVSSEITEQANLIEEILEILDEKNAESSSGVGGKYVWIKYSEETNENINIIELKISDNGTDFPEDGLSDKDGFYYKKITHVLMQDNAGKTAILNITPIEETTE